MAREIEARSEHLGIDDLQVSGCLLEDMGVLLVKTSSLLSEVAVVFAEGQHIKDYSNLRIEQIEQKRRLLRTPTIGLPRGEAFFLEVTQSSNIFLEFM